MLFCRAIIRVFRLWEDHALRDLPSRFVHESLPLITLQGCIRTLSQQDEKGSWSQSPEVTAYSVLTLKSLVDLPWMAQIRETVHRAITLGCQYLELQEAKWGLPSVIWIEKVTYGSGILSHAFCLAAMAPYPHHVWSEEISALFAIPVQGLRRFLKLFSSLPIFSKEPKWRLCASIVEGSMLTPFLLQRQTELHIFPTSDKRIPDYLHYIPATWTLCNNAMDFGLPTRAIVDMMVISMLNFQVDKYLECVTQDKPSQFLFQSLRKTIRELFDDHQEHAESAVREVHRITQEISKDTRDADNGGETMSLLKEVLSRFTCFVLEHPAVLGASKTIQQRLRDELKTFLLAHVAQGEDNFRFHHICPVTHPEDHTMFGGTYYDWVRTTSADHTSCPYSFEFFRCLVSPRGEDCFSGPRARYIGQDLCRHLATLCRQYNDYGSVSRDRLEKNLNSIDFPEFSEYHSHETACESSGEMEKGSREKLLEIADYERQCLQFATEQLKSDIKPSIWRSLGIFIGVTDLYGQIYVVKDINST